MRIRKPFPLAAAVATAAALAIPATTHTRDQPYRQGRQLRVLARIDVSPGQQEPVTWRFQDSATHNVTVRRGPAKFHSKDIRRGSYSRTLTRRGTYKLVCSIHPNMRETIRVS